MPLFASLHGKLWNVTCLWRKSKRNFLDSPRRLRGMIKGRFQTRTDVWGVGGIPIANTPIELVEIDFAGDVDFATSLRIQDTFSRFAVIVFTGQRRQKNKHLKWYEKVRFRIGRQCLGRLKSWRQAKIPDLFGSFSGILYCAQYNFANDNSGPSSKFRGDGA